MPNSLKLAILVILLIIIALCILLLVLNIRKKNIIKKMFTDINNILLKIVNSSPNNDYKIERFEDPSIPYDFKLSNNFETYYIKVVSNLSNQEICVNNSVKWQLRRSYNDESMRFVPDIEGLMRLDLNDKENNNKIFIIYPNARSLLKYINECEMVFIHPNTDVYGASIIPYALLEEDPLKLITIHKEM